MRAGRWILFVSVSAHFLLNLFPKDRLRKVFPRSHWIIIRSCHRLKKWCELFFFFSSLKTVTWSDSASSSSPSSSSPTTPSFPSSSLTQTWVYIFFIFLQSWCKKFLQNRDVFQHDGFEFLREPFKSLTFFLYLVSLFSCKLTPFLRLKWHQTMAP